MTDSWRIETDAEDYFTHQKKKLQVADRRPVIRKASDLVGPGINAHTTRVTDFNDLLATYNGFFSALPDAANAPGAPFVDPDEARGFTGFVASDSSLGGVQRVTELASGKHYSRTFRRGAADPTNITWSPWLPEGPYPVVLTGSTVFGGNGPVVTDNATMTLDFLRPVSQVTFHLEISGFSVTAGSQNVILGSLLTFGVPLIPVPLTGLMNSTLLTLLLDTDGSLYLRFSSGGWSGSNTVYITGTTIYESPI